MRFYLRVSLLYQYLVTRAATFLPPRALSAPYRWDLELIYNFMEDRATHRSLENWRAGRPGEIFA